eukprot:m.219674 g.219674  ORF g.219674 m.219674 type:complete len:681 (+) comp18695_c0_seq23:492-2534(+)
MSMASLRDPSLLRLADPARLEKLESRLQTGTDSQPGLSNDSFGFAPPADTSRGSHSLPRALGPSTPEGSSQLAGALKRKAAAAPSTEGRQRQPRKQPRPEKRDVLSRRSTKEELLPRSPPARQATSGELAEPGSPSEASTGTTRDRQQHITSFMGQATQAPPRPSKPRTPCSAPATPRVTADASIVIQLQEQLAKALEQVAGKDSEISQLKSQVTELSELCETQTKAEEVKTAALEEEVSARALSDLKKARESHLFNTRRLGWGTVVRASSMGGLREEWHKGVDFIALDERRAKLEVRRKQLDEQKRQLAKTKRGKKAQESKRKPDVGAGSDGQDVFVEDEFAEESEILRLQVESLKSEEESVQLLERELVRERNLHIRESRRLEDEAHSRYTVPMKLNKRYVLMCMLGKGGFSEVYKAYDLQECRLVACKIHQLLDSWSPQKKSDYIRRATREYEIHESLDNDHIVRLFDVFEIDDVSFCTVLEYCPGHDLDFVLKQNHSLPEKVAKSKIVQVMHALRYLNTVEPPIIHYDLKPANVLLDQGRVKLTDFGLSKILREDQRDESGNMELTSQGAGTYWYLPPECFVVSQIAPKISSKVDVWSVGVIFYQCLYGRKPFGHNQSQQAILQHQTILRAKEVQFPDKPKVSAEAKAFIRRCLTYDQRARPDVRTLCMDPYIHKS